jgi:glycogen synthase
MQSKKPLRILLLTWELYPLYVGGLGFLAKEVLDELEMQGAEVVTLLPHKLLDTRKNVISMFASTRKYVKNSSSIPNFAFDIDTFYRSNRTGAKPWPAVFQDSKSRDSQNLYPNNTPQLVRGYAHAVQEYLKTDSNFDCIIGMDWLSTPAYALHAQGIHAQIPFWFYINSTERDRTPENKFTATSRAIMELEKTYFADAPKVVAISRVTRDILVQEYEVLPDKVLVVNNSSGFVPNTKGFAELEKGKTIIFIGRVAQQKGLAFLLDTMERVLDFDSQVKCIIAGDGELLHETVENVCARGMENNVLFTGWLNNTQKSQLYKSGDLFVMSSPTEPFGLTPLEAIQSGVAVISSKKCGFLDVIPSTPTYEYHDTQKFAELILYYLHNPFERSQLLTKQQQDFAKHSWKNEIHKLLYKIKNPL